MYNLVQFHGNLSYCKLLFSKFCDLFLFLPYLPVNIRWSRGPGWRQPTRLWLPVQMREHLLSWRKKWSKRSRQNNKVFPWPSRRLHRRTPIRTQSRMSYFRETQAAPWRLPRQTNHHKRMLLLKHRQAHSQRHPWCWGRGSFTLWHDWWWSQTARGAHSAQQLLRNWRLKSEQKSHHSHQLGPIKKVCRTQ